MSERCTIAT